MSVFAEYARGISPRASSAPGRLKKISPFVIGFLMGQTVNYF
jgi:hypothetical protein